MATSQNGWPVATAGQQDTSAVHGVTVPNGVLKGDVAIVLHHLMDRFHREVEPLRFGSCWGWFVKQIEGSSSISNHASGTAIDLNAPDHPMGVRNTFSSTKRAAIRRILDDLDDVVRWGGNYTGRPDDMHFEIDDNATAVHAVALKIKGEDEMTPEQEDALAAKVAKKVWGLDIVPNYAADAATNPTVGAAYGVGRAGIAATVSYQIRDRVDSLAVVLAKVLANVTADDSELQAVQAAIAEAHEATVRDVLAGLGGSTQSDEEIAAALAAALGDRAAAVGQLLTTQG